MKTKTWKLGENAKGGVITVEITGKVVVVICKDWDYSAGSNKSSDQSKAVELERGTITSDEHGAYLKAINYLCDLTTSYYADEIIKWIETQAVLDKKGTYL